MFPKTCFNCKFFDTLGGKHVSSGVCAIPKDGDLQTVKTQDFCIHEPSQFEARAAIAKAEWRG